MTDLADEIERLATDWADNRSDSTALDLARLIVWGLPTIISALRRVEMTAAVADEGEVDRSDLLQAASQDAIAGAEAMRQRDWLRADILLKLAVDQIADAGVLP